MLSESKFTRYLIYAIGEIVLVVIGILIAVQINSTVNDSRLKNENEVLLNKMLSDLDLNKARMLKLAYGDSLSQIGYGFVSLEKAVFNCQTLLDRTYEGLEASDLPFILNERLDAGGSYLNLHNSVYEELLNTGKLYTLGSDDLITAIKEYYKRCEREDLYNRANTKVMYEAVHSIEKSIRLMRLDHRQDSVRFSLKDHPWFYDRNSTAYRELQLALDKMIESQERNAFKMNQIRAYTDTLMNVIEGELSTYYE
jgi:hypothetical protein